MKRNMKFGLAALAIIVAGGLLAFGLTRSRPDALIDMATVVNMPDGGFSMSARSHSVAGFKADSTLSFAFGASTKSKEELDSANKLFKQFEDWTAKLVVEDLETEKVDLRLAAFSTLSPEELKELAQEAEIYTGEMAPIDNGDKPEKDWLTAFGHLGEVVAATMHRSGKTLILVGKTEADLLDMASRVINQPKDLALPDFPEKTKDLTYRLYVNKDFMEQAQDLANSLGAPTALPVTGPAGMPFGDEVVQTGKVSFTDDSITIEALNDPKMLQAMGQKDVPPAKQTYLSAGDIALALSASNPGLPDLDAAKLFGKEVADIVGQNLMMMGTNWGEMLDALRGENTFALSFDGANTTVALRSEKLPGGLQNGLNMLTAFFLRPTDATNVEEGDFKGTTGLINLGLEQAKFGIGKWKDATAVVLGDVKALKATTPYDAAYTTMYIDFPLLWQALDHLPAAHNWRQMMVKDNTMVNLLFNLEKFTGSGDAKKATYTLKALPKDKQTKATVEGNIDLTLPEPEAPVQN